MGCLYQIEFPNGKSYIGITVGTAEARLSEHLYNAKRGIDRGVYRAIRKYGESALKIKTLAIGGWDYLVALEKKTIAAFGTFGCGGYNMTEGGEGALGYKHRPDSLRKMGDTHRGNSYRKGKTFTDETKAKMSAAALGRKLSTETKAKIGEASKGNKYSLGRVQSGEEKTKRSLSQIGKAKGASSGIVGVSFHKATGKWRAHITKNTKFIDLGYFSCIEDAAAARKGGERIYFSKDVEI